MSDPFEDWFKKHASESNHDLGEMAKLAFTAGHAAAMDEIKARAGENVDLCDAALDYTRVQGYEFCTPEVSIADDGFRAGARWLKSKLFGGE
jgi:hypothetical protein